jgi:hypothetical protein
MRCFLLLVLTSLTIYAQSGAPPRAQAGPEDLCSLEGQALSAQTGGPVGKAMISLTRADAPSGAATVPPFSTVSDPAGRFAMDRIEPGRYRLRAFRSGYAEMEYGSRGQGRAGTILALAPGQRMKDIVFRLTPYATISGRALDEDGDPVSTAAVQFLRYRYSNGKKELSAAGTANSDDSGEYRAVRLLPGKYLVSATYRAPWASSIDRSVTPRPEEGYAVTYYPGAIDPASAVEIEVAAGEHLRGIDLTMRKARAATIRGRVVNTAIPGARPSVMLFPDTGLWNNLSLQSVTLDSKGEFEIRGVVSGSYWIMASLQLSGKTYSNRVNVTVAGANVEGVTLTLGAGISVSGRLIVDGETSQDLSSVQARLNQRPNSGLTAGMPPTARVGEGRSFRFDDVSPDQYDVILTSGLPDGFYLKSIHCGETDVLVSGLDASAVPGCAVEIVVSPNAGEVAGSVQNPESQQPAPGASIALIPQEKERRERASGYFSASTDQYGRFAFKSVPPGEYKAYAWEDLEPGAYFDPDFMKPLADKGESVTVREKSQTSLQLKMIPAVTPEDSRKPGSGANQ